MGFLGCSPSMQLQNNSGGGQLEITGGPSPLTLFGMCNNLVPQTWSLVLPVAVGRPAPKIPLLDARLSIPHQFHCLYHLAHLTYIVSASGWLPPCSHPLTLTSMWGEAASTVSIALLLSVPSSFL